MNTILPNITIKHIIIDHYIRIKINLIDIEALQPCSAIVTHILDEESNRKCNFISFPFYYDFNFHPEKYF